MSSAADPHPLQPVILPATYGLELDLRLVSVPAWLDGKLSTEPNATVRRTLEPYLHMGVVRRETVLTSAVNRYRLPDELDEVMRDALQDTTTYAYHHVTNGDLERWKLSREELFAAALREMKAERQEVLPFEGTPNGAPVLLARAPEALQGVALALLPSFVESMKEQVAGEPVFFFPEWDTLIVTGSESPQVIEWAAREARVRFGDARKPISRIPYVRRGAGFEPFALPQARERTVEELDFAETLELWRIEHALAEYEFQKTAVDHHADATVVLGEPESVRYDGDRMGTITSWWEGTTPVIPGADFLLVGPTEGERALVPFDAVRAIAGKRITELPVLPVRYQVSSWFTPAEMTLLRKRSLDFANVSTCALAIL